MCSLKLVLVLSVLVVTLGNVRYVFLFGLLAMSLRYARAISSEEKEKIHAAALPHLEECSTEFGISLDELIKVKESGVLGTLDPCVMRCIYKKSGMIDDKGLFNAKKAEEFPKKYLSDEADRKKFFETISNCKTVNESEVSDGEKGCERAILLFECFRPLKDMIKN